MDGAVEEGAARQFFLDPRFASGAVVEDHRQRVVPRGVLGRVADGGEGFARLERNRRATGVRCAIVGPDLGVRLPEKMFRREIDAPARHGVAVGRARARGHGAAAAGEAGEAEPGGVLAPDQIVGPAVLAEAQQHGGIGDAAAVVGDGDRRLRLAVRGVLPGGGALDRNTHPRCAGAARVLEKLGEDLREGGGIGAGDAPDGALVDAGPDRPGRGIGRTGHGRSSMDCGNGNAPPGG